jgi:transcriptional regulator with XRE-family HTH domain
MRATLTDRVRARLRALIAAKRVRQVDIAAALDLSQANVSSFINGLHGIRLDHLEAIAALLEVPVAELVIGAESTLMDVQPDERRFLIALRKGLRAWQLPLGVSIRAGEQHESESSRHMER